MDIDNFYVKFNIPSIAPTITAKSLSIEDNSLKNVEYEGWGNSEPIPPISPKPIPQYETNPYNIIRQKLGFGHFSPINTDEEDQNE